MWYRFNKINKIYGKRKFIRLENNNEENNNQKQRLNRDKIEGFQF